jgi:hypothetical protein
MYDCRKKEEIRKDYSIPLDDCHLIVGWQICTAVGDAGRLPAHDSVRIRSHMERMNNKAIKMRLNEYENLRREYISVSSRLLKAWNSTTSRGIAVLSSSSRRNSIIVGEKSWSKIDGLELANNSFAFKFLRDTFRCWIASLMFSPLLDRSASWLLNVTFPISWNFLLGLAREMREFARQAAETLPCIMIPAGEQWMLESGYMTAYCFWADSGVGDVEYDCCGHQRLSGCSGLAVKP